MDVSVKIIKLAATSAAIVLCLLAPLFLPLVPQVSASSSIVSPTTSSIPAAITSSGKIHTTVPVRINVQLNAGDTLQGSIVITYGDMIGGAEFYIEDVSGTTVCNFGRVKDSRNFQCTAKTTGLHTIVINNPSITYAAYYELTYDIIPGPPPNPTPTPTPTPEPAPAPTPVIQPPSVLTFSSNPGIITPGDTATLSWSVSNATIVSIDQGIGNVALNGTRIISPITTTIYTLTAGNGQVTISASAQVLVAQSPKPSIWESIISFFRGLLGSNK
jgi:hypothetical protein